jgi:hypothetical protein
MIVAVLVDGVQVNNAYTFLANVSDGSAAGIDINSYSRGGRSGVSLGSPFYRGFVIQMEWFINGGTAANLMAQRDRLATFFRVKPDKSATQTKTLSFVMIDGSVRTIEAIFAPFNGQISPQNVASCSIAVSAQTEKEYMVSSIESSEIVNVFDGGGFKVPFNVPFSLANYPSQSSTNITNTGNSEYHPWLEVHGDLDTFVLTNQTTGKQISYEGVLEIGDVLRMDLYERTAILNGNTNALADVNEIDWWLDPGVNQITLSTTSGGGYVEIFYKHAYRGL